MSVSVCVSVKLHLHVDVLGVVEGGEAQKQLRHCCFSRHRPSNCEETPSCVASNSRM